MNCGSVLEDSLIVSEVQFEEMGHGAAAIGQFVSAESSGGATNYGYGKFQVGSGTESREVTIKKAKKDITLLCQQLQLTQHYADTALNFFKMALNRHLTRGRKSTHIYAACVYMTCRTEGTSRKLNITSLSIPTNSQFVPLPSRFTNRHQRRTTNLFVRTWTYISEVIACFVHQYTIRG